VCVDVAGRDATRGLRCDATRGLRRDAVFDDVTVAVAATDEGEADDPDTAAAVGCCARFTTPSNDVFSCLNAVCVDAFAVQAFFQSVLAGSNLRFSSAESASNPRTPSSTSAGSAAGTAATVAADEAAESDGCAAAVASDGDASAAAEPVIV
jgi:hypothetical protein